MIGFQMTHYTTNHKHNKALDSNIVTNNNNNNIITNGSTTNGNHKKLPKRSISWTQLLLPSYKSRLLEFRRLFTKSVPTNERLIADFSCALQKEILIQGRLYLSMNYLSFHANIFGWETVVSIRLADVRSLNKANTIRVIPNAIQLVTSDGHKYIFTSFVARDKAFKRVYRLWQDVLIGQKMSIPEVWQLIRHNYGTDLGLSSDSGGDEELDQELDVVTRNNINMVEEELVADDDDDDDDDLDVVGVDTTDDVFADKPVNQRKRHKIASIASLLKCPEPDMAVHGQLIGDRLVIGGQHTTTTTTSDNNNKYKSFVRLIPKWLNNNSLFAANSAAKESLLLRILLLLSLMLLIVNITVLYKLTNINQNYYDYYNSQQQKHTYLDVNIHQLRQSLDLSKRLVKDLAGL
ncbi:protein Aster-B-like [Oppia nitens]|uniref:protein Aster-B-like n=1 Tax=Oppia nitens TaxID=1686743 RepID=UPI0023DC2397|nr:protein Aster-B-like [Oppia nitens]